MYITDTTVILESPGFVVGAGIGLWAALSVVRISAGARNVDMYMS